MQQLGGQKLDPCAPAYLGPGEHDPRRNRYMGVLQGVKKTVTNRLLLSHTVSIESAAAKGK